MPPAVVPLWKSSVSDLRLLYPTDRGFKLTGKRARGGRIDLWLTQRSVPGDILRQVQVPFEEAEAITGAIAVHGMSVALHSQPLAAAPASPSRPASPATHTLPCHRCSACSLLRRATGCRWRPAFRTSHVSLGARFWRVLTDQVTSPQMSQPRAFVPTSVHPCQVLVHPCVLTLALGLL